MILLKRTWGLVAGSALLFASANFTFSLIHNGLGVQRRAGEFFAVQGRAQIPLDSPLGPVWWLVSLGFLVVGVLAAILSFLTFLEVGSLRPTDVLPGRSPASLAIRRFVVIATWTLAVPGGVFIVKVWIAFVSRLMVPW